jgi:hypothetical protein
VPKYHRTKYVSRIDPGSDLNALLAMDDDNMIGNRRTALHLTTWEAVTAFKQQEKILSQTKMVRGRVKEGNPDPANDSI